MNHELSFMGVLIIEKRLSQVPNADRLPNEAVFRVCTSQHALANCPVAQSV